MYYLRSKYRKMITSALCFVLMVSLFTLIVFTFPPKTEAQIGGGGGSTVADHIIDQTSKTDTGGVPFYMSPNMLGDNNGHNATSIAFSFTADGSYLAYIGLMMAKTGGAGIVWSITNYPGAYISIYDNNPATNTPNNWIADTNPLSWTSLTLTTRISEINFTCSTPTRLNAGDTYWMVLQILRPASWRSDMYLTIEAPTAIPPANNGVTLTQPPTTWNTITPNQGVCFTAYGITYQPDIIDQITANPTARARLRNQLWQADSAGSYWQAAISFTGNGDNVTAVDFNLQIGTTVTADEYFISYIYNVDSNRLPIGAPIATSDIIYASDYADNTLHVLTFNFDGILQVSNGVNYCVSIGLSSDTTYNVGAGVYLGTSSDLSGIHGNVFSLISNYDNVWVTDTIHTLPFTLYGTKDLITVTYRANFPLDAVNATGVTPIDHFFYAVGDSVNVFANQGNLSATNYVFLGWAYDINAVTPDFVVPDLVTVNPATLVAGDSNVALFGVWSSSVQYFATVIFRQYEIQGGTINHDLDTEYLFEVGTFEFFTGTPATNFAFMGWLNNGTMMSTTQDYNFYIASEDTFVVTAIFYDPESKNLGGDELLLGLVIGLLAVLAVAFVFVVMWVRTRKNREPME